eukprot:1056993_1
MIRTISFTTLNQSNMVLFVVNLLFMISIWGCQSMKTYRIPSTLNNTNIASSDCSSSLCAGAGSYPSSAQIRYYAEFDIPPLPTSFDPVSMTYYIYFNIFFDNPLGGKYNQFVPQLMLGNVLSGSSNSPYYQPVFTQPKHYQSQYQSLSTPSQYFFALMNDSDPDGWSAYASTGGLVPTQPGDVLYTQFNLSDNEKTWTLTMGIKTSDNSGPVSTVTTDKPYMGLLNTTKSWNEGIYNHTNVGSCWELYGLQEKDNYPYYMNYVQRITTTHPADWWNTWIMDEIPDCSFAPKYSLTSTVNQRKTDQVALFDIYY